MLQNQCLRFWEYAPKSVPSIHAIFYVLHWHQVACIETYFWQLSVSFLHRCYATSNLLTFLPGITLNMIAYLLRVMCVVLWCCDVDQRAVTKNKSFPVPLDVTSRNSIIFFHELDSCRYQARETMSCVGMTICVLATKHVLRQYSCITEEHRRFSTGICARGIHLLYTSFRQIL